MGCVPRSSGFRTRRSLKFPMERDECHPSEWATYQSLVFRHVASCVSRVMGPDKPQISDTTDQRLETVSCGELAQGLIM
jgi:hypothetical protein